MVKTPLVFKARFKMATFFGEVLPVTNRAYNDAEDDDEATHECSNPFKVTHSSKECKLSADVVVVACGNFATAYIDSLLPLDSQPVATVDRCSSSESGGDTEDVNRLPSPAQLHRLSPETCVVRCTAFIPDDHHYWLAETVLSQFESDATVVVLGSAPLTEFLSSAATYDDRPSLLVRQLATRGWKLSTDVATLDPPNVVKGTAAAVLSRCSLSGSSACLLLLYTSALRPDAETAAALHGAARAAVPALRPLQPRRARWPADTPYIYM